MKTPGGVSHVIRGSVCNFGPRAGRLRFGDGSITANVSSYMSIVVSARKGNPAVLDIIDGVLSLPKLDMAVLGTARVQDQPVKRGTFVVFRHRGGGVTGKARYTGSWRCG